MPIVVTKPVITATYLVVDEDGTVMSSHPQTIELSLTADSFIQALNDLIEAKSNLDLTDEEVHMLMTTGNLLSLGNVQAATLGVQGQYQFPTAVGLQGQVLGYQGSSQLAWVTGGSGAQGNQGYQGLQGAGGSGAQGNQGYQGLQGAGGSGAQGNQGYQGLQGAGGSGNQGNQGYQGLQGNQGNQGNQGYQGYQGFQQGFALTMGGNTTGTGALVSSGTLTLAGGNNITLSQATAGGNAITIVGPIIYSYNNNPYPNGINSTVMGVLTATSGSMSLYPFQVTHLLAAEYAGVVVSMNYGSGGLSSLQQSGTLQWGIYSRPTGANSTQLSLMGSSSLSYGHTYNNSSMSISQATTTNASGVYSYALTNSAGVALSSQYTGLKLMLLGLNSTIEPGQYYFGLHHRNSFSSFSSGISMSLIGVQVSSLSNMAPMGSMSSAYNTGTALGGVIGNPWFMGAVYSVAGQTALTNQVTMSQMTVTGASAQFLPYILFGSRT